MKYLFPCLLLLPFISSCMEQQQSYYNPSPSVEVHQNHSPAASGATYQRHIQGRGNRVIINSSATQIQGPVNEQQNHQGHTGPRNLRTHSHSVGRAVIVPGAARGQNNNVHGKSQQIIQVEDEAPTRTHRHH